MANAARQLSMHMIHPGPAHCKALGYMIEYLKGIEKKDIVIRKLKVLKAVMFCDSNYVTDTDTRNSFSGLVTTLVVTILTCL